jgi:hypothetical protein
MTVVGNFHQLKKLVEHPLRYSTKMIDLGLAPLFFSRFTVELLELGVFDWKNLERS